MELKKYKIFCFELKDPDGDTYIADTLILEENEMTAKRIISLMDEFESIVIRKFDNEEVEDWEDVIW